LRAYRSECIATLLTTTPRQLNAELVPKWAGKRGRGKDVVGGNGCCERGAWWRGDGHGGQTRVLGVGRRARGAGSAERGDGLAIERNRGGGTAVRVGRSKGGGVGGVGGGGGAEWVNDARVAVVVVEAGGVGGGGGAVRSGRWDTRVVRANECVVVRGEGTAKSAVWERRRRHWVRCWACGLTEDLRGACSGRSSALLARVGAR